MRKILLAFALLCGSAVFADDDRPIALDLLPNKARTFLSEHFDSRLVQLRREADDDSYEALLADGTKIEFDKRGRWTEVEGRKIPVKALPEKVAAYLRQYHPKAVIKNVSREGKYYEVEFSNGREITLDKKGRLKRND